MRITLVTETFPPEINGVAMTLGRLVEAMRGRGHTLQVLRPRQSGEVAASELLPGIPLPFYPEVRLGLARVSRVLGLLRESQAELVHIATQGPLGWAALRAAQRLGLPVVSSFHTNFDQYAAHYHLTWLAPLVRAGLRHFHNRTAMTLVPSQMTQKKLRAQGFERVQIWSRGVDASCFHPQHRDVALRASLGLGEDGLLLLYVGRLAPEKNLQILLDAYARLRQQYPEAMRARLRLLLVGAGPMLAALRAKPLDGLVLGGMQTGVDLSRWYASADLFVFPSLSETFGNVILEAQASGLAVVGFDCQGVNERVDHGCDGLLVQTQGAFLDAMATLCQDGDLRQHMAQAALRKTREQRWDVVFTRLEQQYLEVLAGAPCIAS